MFRLSFLGCYNTYRDFPCISSTVARAAACLQDLFQMQCWLQGMLHRSHLEFLVQARLQACSTVARAAACLQDQFKMQCWLQGMLHRSHLEFLVQARLQACSTVEGAAIMFAGSVSDAA